MRTNMFLDPNLLKTEQELMVEELEREQALEAEATLQMESIDRMLDLQHLVSQAGSMNDGIRYSVEEHLGYVPETLELTEEGLLDSIWKGIKAFFKAIADFFLKIFGMESKEASSDGLTAKQKETMEKFMKSKITVKPSEICFANRDKLSGEMKAAARSGEVDIDDDEITEALSVLTPEFDEKYPKRIQALQELGLLPGGKVSWELANAFPDRGLDLLQETVELSTGVRYMGSPDFVKSLTMKDVYRKDTLEFMGSMYSVAGQDMPTKAVELNSSVVKDALNTKLASIRSIDFAFPNPTDLEKWLENFQNYRYNLLKGGVKQKLEALRNIKEPKMKTNSPEETKAHMDQLRELGKCMRLYLDLQIKTLAVIKQGKEAMLQYYAIVAMINTIRE